MESKSPIDAIINIKNLNEHAVVVQFDKEVMDPIKINQIANQLKIILNQKATALIPASDSLTIECLYFDDVIDDIKKVISSLDLKDEKANYKRHNILIDINLETSLDAQRIKSQLDLDLDDLKSTIERLDLRVLHKGFLPGFAYMGYLPERLQLPRLDTPRKKVPAGSVAIANNMLGIYPLDSPGGWNVIGYCNHILISEDSDDTGIFNVGDYVKFQIT